MILHELQPDALMAFDRVPEHTLHGISIPMPPWLSAASQSVRDAYSVRLAGFHAAANALETHLEQVLPGFDAFVHAQLSARIEAELGLRIDPDVVMIDLPESVSRDYDINPQFGHIKNYSAPWVASVKRELLSLSALAKRNFLADDEQMARRLDFAVIELDDSQAAAGLTGPWLQVMIPQLDVAQGYRTRLEQVFDVQPDGSQPQQDLAHLMLEPYARQIELQGFAEHVRKRLSSQGYRMLTLAAQARNRAETDAAGLEMLWVQFKPGASLNGDHDSHTLSGLCLIRDMASNHSLLYLPQPVEGLVLIEASSPDQIRSRLIEKLLSQPALVDHLAERTLDGPHVARHASYINQALLRGFDGFIRFVPALDLQLARQQLQARVVSLHQSVEAVARRKTELVTERNQHLNQTLLGYFRAMLGLLPGIGTLISLEEGWISGQQAVQAFESGSLDDRLLGVGSTALSVLDVALSVVPGAASIALLTRLSRRGSRLGTAAVNAGHAVLKPFEGYEVSRSLADALPQAGRDAGTLLKDGQLWIERQGQTYAVYRRGGEQTLRLRKTALHGYEPPIRLEHGQWVYHTEVGLRGGVRSTIAESLIAEAHGDPAFKSRHARQLLDQFEFPADRQRRLELDIAVHYQKHRAIPEWADAYRRPPETAAPSPQPGPSGVKRKDPPTSEHPIEHPAAVIPPASAVPQRGPDAWKAWGRPLNETDNVAPVDRRLPVFRVADGQGSDFIHIEGHRYEVLPSGSNQHPSIVFLKNPAMTDDSFSGLNEVIRGNRYDQPIMAAFEQGRWHVKGPLFKLKIQLLVEQARAGMTPATYRILAERIYNACDPGHTGLTATRLIHMRATLNAWQTGQIPPVIGLHDPLSMLEGTPLTTLNASFARLRLSYGPSLQAFTRLDFTAHGPILEPLLRAALNNAHFNASGRGAVRELMRGVLTHAGYHMVSAGETTLQHRSILLFRRPGHEPLYLLNVRRISESRVDLRISEPGAAIAMSNRWIDQWLASHPQDVALNMVVEARTQGLLIKMVGGIRVCSSTDSGTQIFVQRLAADF